MGRLSGKTAIVLGASGSHSFGRGIAELYAREGANVVVSARRQGPLEELASEIGGKAVACDITDDDQIGALAKAAVDEYGSLDIAVNCAGILAGAPIAMLKPENIKPTMDISFMGSLLFFKHMGNAMAQTGGGSVITISSLTARIPGLGLAVYSGCRAGIDYAVRVAAHEYGPQGVRFNSIAAGLIKTDMTDALFESAETEKGHIQATPLRRMGSIDDIAQTALYLGDEAASGYVTGQLIDVAGGQNIGSLPNQEALEA